MHGSVAIWVIIIVAVIALTAWLTSVRLAARRPSQKHAHGERIRGDVQGGMHIGGGGRSVAPRRDEEVTEGQVPSGSTLHPDPDHRVPADRPPADALAPKHDQANGLG